MIALHQCLKTVNFIPLTSSVVGLLLRAFDLTVEGEFSTKMYWSSRYHRGSIGSCQKNYTN